MTVENLFAGSAELPFDLQREVSCMGQHRQWHDWDGSAGAGAWPSGRVVGSF